MLRRLRQRLHNQVSHLERRGLRLPVCRQIHEGADTIRGAFPRDECDHDAGRRPWAQVDTESSISSGLLSGQCTTAGDILSMYSNSMTPTARAMELKDI